MIHQHRLACHHSDMNQRVRVGGGVLSTPRSTGSVNNHFLFALDSARTLSLILLAPTTTQRLHQIYREGQQRLPVAHKREFGVVQGTLCIENVDERRVT